MRVAAMRGLGSAPPGGFQERVDAGPSRSCRTGARRPAAPGRGATGDLSAAGAARARARRRRRSGRRQRRAPPPARRHGRRRARAGRGRPRVTWKAQSLDCRRQQLAQRPRRRRRARRGRRQRVRSSSARARQARSATGVPSQVDRSRGVPQLVAGSSPARTASAARAVAGRVGGGERVGHRHRAVARERVVEVGDPQPLALGLVEHRLQPGDPLVPPVAEQLGVDRADGERGAAQRGGAGVEARDRARDEVGRVGARLRQRGGVVVTLAGVVPDAVVVDGQRVVVAIGAVGGVAVVAPDELDRRAVDRHQQRPVGARSGASWAALPRPRTSVRSRQTAWTPASSSSGSSHGACAHSGSQKPPRHSRAPTASSRARCEAIPVSSCSRTPASVASSGSTAWVADEVQARVAREGGEQTLARVAAPASAPARARSRRRRAPARRPSRRGRSRGAVGVEFVRDAADVAQEGCEALGQARRRELVGEHRREREGDLLAAPVEQLQQRQVAARQRLPQPLLAERPGAVALDVRHVRVQDERQLAAVPAGGHRQTRQTATKSSARSSSLSSPALSVKSEAAIAGVKRS